MRHAVIIAAVLAAVPATSFADLVAYQGFDGTTYTSGTSMIGAASGSPKTYNAGGVLAANTTATGGTAFGWSGNWIPKFADVYTSGLATVSASGLTAPTGVAQISTTGKAATITTPSRTDGSSATFVDVGLAGAVERSAPTYVSFMMSRPGSDPALNLYFGLISGVGGSEIAEVGFLQTNPAVFGIKVSTGGGNFTTYNSTAAIPNSTPSLVVVKLDYGTADAGGLYKTLTMSLWINPTSDVEADQVVTLANKSGTNATGQAAIGGIRLAAADTNSTVNTGTFDEIRIGTSFADVVPVPEPTTAGLTALGFGSMLVAGRRR